MNATTAALLLDARRDAQRLCLSPTEALAMDISDRLFRITDQYERDRELAKVLNILARTCISGSCGVIQDIASDLEHDAKLMLDEDPDAPTWPKVEKWR